MAIRAVVFDLDGTLVQTERLKAQSYAKATVELCPYTVTEGEVIDAFKDVVGLSRKEAAEGLIAKYNLEEKAAARMDEFGVSTPWQAFVQVRMKYYADMLADPDVLRNNQWPHNVELLHAVREHGCSTALATMSHCEQVNYVVDTLELRPLLDFIATRDDVNNGKPDPEIYNLVRGTFGHPADTMLVIEDSPSGVKAAIAAGMHVIAVSTPFTMEKLRTETDMDGQYIVDDPADLMGVVKQFVAVAE